MGTLSIPLTQGKIAIIDEEDYPLVSKSKWFAVQFDNGLWYAYTNRPRRIAMHRVIMGDPPGMLVDHKDGDGLRNTRDNLRVCTRAQNLQNRRGPTKKSKSGYMGVSPVRGRWVVYIGVDGKSRYIGTYDSPEEAARASDESAIRFHGEFASLNFPPSAEKD